MSFLNEILPHRVRSMKPSHRLRGSGRALFSLPTPSCHYGHWAPFSGGLIAGLVSPLSCPTLRCYWPHCIAVLIYKLQAKHWSPSLGLIHHSPHYCIIHHSGGKHQRSLTPCPQHTVGTDWESVDGLSAKAAEPKLITV